MFRILLVEDSIDLKTNVNSLVQLKTVDGAIKALKEREYDLIILDYDLSQYGHGCGADILNYILDNQIKTIFPVILQSSYLGYWYNAVSVLGDKINKDDFMFIDKRTLMTDCKFNVDLFVGMLTTMYQGMFCNRCNKTQNHLAERLIYNGVPAIHFKPVITKLTSEQDEIYNFASSITYSCRHCESKHLVFRKLEKYDKSGTKMTIEVQSYLVDATKGTMSYEVVKQYTKQGKADSYRGKTLYRTNDLHDVVSMFRTLASTKYKEYDKQEDWFTIPAGK